MAGVGDLDVPRRLAPLVPVWLTMVVVGVACSAASWMVRAALEAMVPGVAPFAFIFPAAMLATLFARWPAGAVSATVSTLYALYFLFPVRNSFQFESPGGAASVGSVAFAAAVTVLLAELFRSAAQRATHERDRQIADRDLFLAEFDHRVKNNFMVVTSLLDLQRRRAAEPATVEALGTALSRVESISRAHRHLYRGGSDHSGVDMQTYLTELCAALGEALLLNCVVVLLCEADPARIPRDRAVSIGLVVNELVTNAAKHAFVGRDAGEIRVTFRSAPRGWVLTVADNGIGMPATPPIDRAEGGLGQRLIEAFARQAGGRLSITSDPTGTEARLELEG